jgi:hypothetical protein
VGLRYLLRVPQAKRRRVSSRRRLVLGHPAAAGGRSIVQRREQSGAGASSRRRHLLLGAARAGRAPGRRELPPPSADPIFKLCFRVLQGLFSLLHRCLYERFVSIPVGRKPTRSKQTGAARKSNEAGNKPPCGALLQAQIRRCSYGYSPYRLPGGSDFDSGVAGRPPTEAVFCPRGSAFSRDFRMNFQRRRETRRSNLFKQDMHDQMYALPLFCCPFGLFFLQKPGYVP